MFSQQQMGAVVNEEELRRSLVALCRDIRGIVLAFHSRNMYMILFDWMYPLTLPHSHSQILTLPHTLIFSHSLTHTLRFSHSLTHTHTPPLTLPHSHSHSPTHTLRFSQSLTHTPPLTLPHSHSHSQILTVPHSHSQILTLPHSNSQILTLPHSHSTASLTLTLPHSHSLTHTHSTHLYTCSLCRVAGHVTLDPYHQLPHLHRPPAESPDLVVPRPLSHHSRAETHG